MTRAIAVNARPIVRRLRVSRRIRERGGLPRLVSSKRRATIRFRLSEDAKVTLTSSAGCPAGSSGRCEEDAPEGHQGLNRVSFHGRLESTAR